MRLYVHGAGRSGEAAWPGVPRDDAVFADLGGVSMAPAKAAVLVELAEATPALVIAHSGGAVPVLLAIASGTIPTVHHVVLIEPALYDVARGHPAIEQHIAMMSSARERARAGDLFGFWSIVRPVMFGGPADPAAWDDECVRAEHFASVELPWGHGVAAETIARVPTLVVTGDWNDEYEAIAEELTVHGAEHRHLRGFGHRPQDHPDFPALVDEFAGSATRP